MNEILIPTDGSPSADEAVEFGVELAAEQHARVTFMHVMAPIDWTQLDRGSVIQPIPSDLPLAHETILSEAVRFAASRDVAARVEVVAGMTANEIVAYGDSIEADLIVLGSRSRGAVASVLLGSVSRATPPAARGKTATEVWRRPDVAVARAE